MAERLGCSMFLTVDLADAAESATAPQEGNLIKERCFGCNGDMSCFVQELHFLMCLAETRTFKAFNYELIHFLPQTWYCNFKEHLYNYIILRYKETVNGKSNLPHELDEVYKLANLPGAVREEIYKEVSLKMLAPERFTLLGMNCSDIYLNLRRGDIVGSKRHEARSAYAVNEEPPTESEVLVCIQKMKDGKSDGDDGISAEMLKYLPPSGIHEMTKIIRSIWIDERIPDSWKHAVIIPFHKKLFATDPRNYRGISLTRVMYKVLEIIILDRLIKHREETTRDEQAGFRPGRPTIDQVFIVRRVIDIWQRYSKPMQVAFLNFEAAFDSSHRGRLLNALRANGVPGKTFLFNFAIDDIRRKTVDQCSADIVLAPSGCPLTDLEHADDVVIFAGCSTKLQHVVNLVSKLAATYGLRLRPDKCKQMWISSRPRTGIRVDGQPIELVNEFCYLGCTLKNSGSCERNVQQRCTRATSAFNSLTKCLWSNSITNEVKVRVYLSAIRPIIMYGSETWVAPSTFMERLDCTERKLFGRLLGYIWPRVCHNEDLYAEIDVVCRRMTRGRCQHLASILRRPADRPAQRVRRSFPGSRSVFKGVTPRRRCG
ncbi:hypothetical protein RB195_014539 [Necator americanus]|uniref:Reverse transcriptase domain-containing protein n=1 Tax=Necator americanus TaxID=51031 RepID=A0ABR1E0J9_NECAM